MSAEFWAVIGVGAALAGLQWRMYASLRALIYINLRCYAASKNWRYDMPTGSFPRRRESMNPEKPGLPPSRE